MILTVADFIKTNL